MKPAATPQPPTPDALAELFRGAPRVVFLTGAGISTESGIPDFRSASGLYANGVGESVFDVEVFRRDPRPFYAFARSFYPLVAQAKPNAAHLAITRLAQAGPWQVTVVTQNVDTLHQDAGNPAVHPVHGGWRTSRCLRCDHEVQTTELLPAIARGEIPTHPECGGVYKPEIVFFGENLPDAAMTAADRAIYQADLLVIAGTALAVYPAAALPAIRRPACRLVIINRDPTHLDHAAQLCFRDGIGSVLNQAVTQTVLRRSGR